ncbi:carbon-nitrogen hydrolase family protein [Microbulbifer sp. TRSA001]|uniref:carbon-nitrogen hydrolase family protein n=1 Tax=Microbulbifer sp. TRSA001 TaxID=3243381 RepID=UPI0040396D86
MGRFKLALAQLPSEKGNIERNIESHIHAVKVAVRKKASIVVFPELSLTGYEPDLAEQLALKIDDRQLSPLADLAADCGVWLVVGAPIRQKNGIAIGSLVFSPQGEISVYLKIHLHPGEEKWFVPGSEYLSLNIEGETVALAICADVCNPGHVATYEKQGASVYVAGVLITPMGYPEDSQQLANYALEHNLLVAIANFNQPTGGYSTAGCSAVWGPEGEIVSASDTASQLVCVERDDEGWCSEIVSL